MACARRDRDSWRRPADEGGTGDAQEKGTLADRHGLTEHLDDVLLELILGFWRWDEIN